MQMKKDSNSSLFFLLGIGIVGLGLYFSATNEYGSMEIHIYHFVCWIVLLIALIRILELIWEPIRALWNHAWGKAWDAGMAGEERDRKERFFYSEVPGRKAERPSEGGEGERTAGRADNRSFVKKEVEECGREQGNFCGESDFHGESGFCGKSGFHGEPVILDEQGRRVIIVPDPGPRLSLEDSCAKSAGGRVEPGNRYAEPEAGRYCEPEHRFNGTYSREVSAYTESGGQKKNKKKNGKKKKKAKE